MGSSDFPSYGSESKKRYTIRLFFTYLEVGTGGVLEVVLSGWQMIYLGDRKVGEKYDFNEINLFTNIFQGL